jgi:hypothetical protein
MVQAMSLFSEHLPPAHPKAPRTQARNHHKPFTKRFNKTDVTAHRHPRPGSKSPGTHRVEGSNSPESSGCPHPRKSPPHPRPVTNRIYLIALHIKPASHCFRGSQW